MPPYRALLLALKLGLVACSHQASQHNVPFACDDDPLFNGPPPRSLPLIPTSDLARNPLPSRTLPPELTTELDAIVSNTLLRAETPAVSAAIALPTKGRWQLSAGHASLLPPQRVEDYTLFHWASVGKAFTATIIARLIERGLLHHDDRLSTWFADYPYASLITIRQLLNHTAGVYRDNFSLADPGAYITPADSIQFAATQTPPSCPGSEWHYSNLAYVLLGQIAERVSGQPFHTLIEQDIVAPLHLAHTLALAPQQVPQPYAVGHIAQQRDDAFSPSMPYAAGNIVATADDMVTFWHALLSEKLLTTESLQQRWQSLYAMEDAGLFYGHGVMLFEQVDTPSPVHWLGHAGGTRSSNAVVFYDIETGAFIAVAINGRTSAVALANQLRKRVRQFLFEGS